MKYWTLPAAGKPRRGTACRAPTICAGVPHCPMNSAPISKMRLLPLALFLALALPFPAFSESLRTDIFPGECEPQISAATLRAYDLALDRNYEAAKKICA